MKQTILMILSGAGASVFATGLFIVLTHPTTDDLGLAGGLMSAGAFAAVDFGLIAVSEMIRSGKQEPQKEE